MIIVRVGIHPGNKPADGAGVGNDAIDPAVPAADAVPSPSVVDVDSTPEDESDHEEDPSADE